MPSPPAADASAALRVRAGTSDDVAFVFACIRDLAEFEKLLHEMQASEESLREHLFGERRYAEILIGEIGGERAGYALFFSSYSTFLTRPGIFLEDLFVQPAFRGRGLATALLIELARLAVKRGCGRLEWSVLDWNRRAIDFYDSLGAVPVRGWISYRITGQPLADLAARPASSLAGSPE
ncbi:MAG TPA: GNAT family N-acetyltransferase [Candidatus Binatia bacterium]|nr:GNAT family N-acetyltransferase [Candidatus Binatia bacterium]